MTVGTQRLFLYGTLLDGDTLARQGGEPALADELVPATLAGWQRVAARGGRYPTLRRARAGRVNGAIVDVSARALAKLAAYEGPAYRLTRVVVHAPYGKTVAHTWIAPAGTRHPWNPGGRSPCSSSRQPDPACVRTK
jgi:gamma-glutamylcyclotransferase (GGCT)/AIG2-like uncharacterized protein YtfP